MMTRKIFQIMKRIFEYQYSLFKFILLYICKIDVKNILYKQYKELIDMEKRLNNKIQEYLNTLKNDILQLSEKQCCNETAIIFKNYLDNYANFELSKDDFIKRKRVKNIVPYHDRCFAYRANGERCTRRKKDKTQFCGTHNKGQPHGVVSDNDELSMVKFKKITVRQQDIKGIIYYIDDNSNVYDPNDIMNGTKNPRIIAKYNVDGETYHIPSFGL